MTLLNELKRRGVLRVGAGYLAGAWLLIQIVGQLAPLFEFTNAAGRTLIVVLAIGFVPALVISWVFEWTPTGLERDKGVEDPAPAHPRHTRRFDRAIMVVLALAVVLFAVDRFVLAPARDAERLRTVAEQARLEARLGNFGNRSIAVLPCTDLSDTGDQEYFADGIAEEVLNLLAKIPELRVAARTSAFSFKGKRVTVPEIAVALKVANVLECSVRRAGGRLRITTKLVEAPTDVSIWAETYDREMGDVFAIQEDIAARVAEGLRVTLIGPAVSAEKTSPELFELYTLANYVNESRSSTVARRLPEMREKLERAIQQDPNYAPLRDALARTYMRLITTTAPAPAERQELVRALHETVMAAVERWPDRPATVARYGYTLAIVDGDLERGAREVQRAHESDPNDVFALRTAAQIAAALHRIPLAIEIQEYVLRRDPFCTECRNVLIADHVATEEYERAEKLYEEALGLDLELGDEGRLYYGLALLGSGDSEAALEEFKRLPPPRSLVGTTVANHDLNRQEEFERGLAQIKRMVGETNPILAQIYVWMNELDSAVEIWNAQPALSPAMFEDDVVRARMSRDPRWQSLAERAGVWPDPYGHITFDIKVPEH